MSVLKVDLREKVGSGYGAFWYSRHRYRVVKGGKASKKSCTAALWFIVNLMKHPEANLLVVRSVYDTHRNSTFAVLKWAIRQLGVGDKWKAVTSPLELRYLPTGQRIIFKGFDDWQKLASTTVDYGYLCWVWIEEAFEISSEADFDKLDLSVPRGQIPPNLFHQTTITFNPWSEKHWLKKRFFDTPREDTLAITTNYLCNEFLDPSDIEKFERMKEENPRLYDVAGLGNWGVSEGLIYERWEIKSFDKDNIGGDESWKFKHVFGLDYGYTNDPTAFIAMAVNAVDKEIYIYDEHYETRMLNEDIARMIKSKGFAKERIIADCAEPKSNDDLRRLGITRLTAARKGKDSIRNGIAKIQEYKIYVHPDCVNTIAELSSYVWDKTKDGEVINKPVDKNNHLMDAMRYAMEDTIFFRPEKKEDFERRYKKLAKLSLYSGAGEIRATDFKGGWG